MSKDTRLDTATIEELEEYCRDRDILRDGMVDEAMQDYFEDGALYPFLVAVFGDGLRAALVEDSMWWGDEHPDPHTASLEEVVEWLDENNKSDGIVNDAAGKLMDHEKLFRFLSVVYGDKLREKLIYFIEDDSRLWSETQEEMARERKG